MTNPGSFQKDAHAFRLQTHTQGPWGWVCGIQFSPHPSSASLHTLPIQQLLQETKPNVSKIKGKVVWGLVGGTGQSGWLPGAGLGRQDKPKEMLQLSRTIPSTRLCCAAAETCQTLRVRRQPAPTSLPAQKKKKKKWVSGPCKPLYPREIPPSLSLRPSRAGSRVRRRVANCLRCSFLMFASE